MDTKKLRQKILDLAIHGKLVPQDPNDEPASVLLERIKAEKERLIKEGKIKRGKKRTKTSGTPHYENVPFKVPEGWEWCKLEDITKIIGDGLHGTPEYDFNGEYFFVNGNNLHKRKILIKEETKRVSILEYEKYRKPLDDTTVLISINGTIGNVAIYNGEKIMLGKSACYINLCQQINKQYICSILESNFFLKYAIESATGSTIKNVPLRAINEFLLPLPPLAEQQRIITEIERWFALIDMIEHDKADLQTIIKQTKSKILDLAIHGKLVPQDPNDEPASELLKRINPKAEITCDNAQYEKIPENWCACKLVDICSFLSRGKSPKYSEYDKTYPVFAQKCNLKDGGISLEQARFLDPSTINKWNEVYKLQTGDILVNSTGTGTVGRTRLFNANCLGNYPFVVPDSHVSVVRMVKSICPQYVYAYISSDSIQQYIEENLAGSTNQKELYIGVLENMHIFLPPLSEQYRIVTKIEKLFSSLDNIQKALEV